MTGQRFIAEHVKPLGSSGIRRVFELGATLDNPIDLSIGQPDFPVPDNIKSAMCRAIQDDHNSYTPSRGLPALRERIAHELKSEFDWEPDLFVTNGVSGGLFLALLACVNPGDEVLMGDPYFVSYRQLVTLVGGVPVLVDLYDDFQVHPERFEAAITEKTKLMIMCSPGNPTGVVYNEEDVRSIAEIARRNDILILSDEIYNKLFYDGQAPSPVAFAKDNTLLLRGFGKSYALTGHRLGYAAGPEEVIAQMAKLQQFTYVCAPHPSQYGALEAMDTDVSSHVRDYRAKRDLVCKELAGTFEFVRPSGGFYVFPKAPKNFPSASAFVDEAISRNVLIIPGDTFSQRDTHFRISYAASDEKIREGCAILRELAG